MKRRAELEFALERFEAACAEGRVPQLEEYTPVAASPHELCELARADLEWAWRRGDARPLGEYLARYPALTADRRGLSDLAFAEFRLRWLHGDPVPPEVYRAAFDVEIDGWSAPGAAVAHAPTCRPPDDPAHYSRTRVLEHHSVIAPSSLMEKGEVPLPRAGETFLGFQLVHELGRGAFGRVYLARQEGLADRLVALKVSTDLFDESRNLAQLQHTNIVPIYSLHRTGALFAVCMPYFGCTTLADLCRSLGQSDGLPTSGRLVVSTVQNRRSTLRGLDQPAVAEPSGEHVPLSAPPALLSLERMAYVDTVLSMGARLADGLHHAHERGILHLDLKPANVLLTDDGRPMLLDFNLSEDIKARGTAGPRAHVGGTLPYMAPEQMRAFAGGGPADYDGRADVYALGLILFQLLTGRPAFGTIRGAVKDVVPVLLEDRLAGPPPLSPLNPSITPAVEAIILRCLRPDRQQRYASARELAEDIEAHRANRPLRHQAEPCWVERFGKWVRRNPTLVSPWTLGGLAVSAVLSLGALGAMHSLREAERSLERRRAAAATVHARFDDLSGPARVLLASDDPEHLSEGARQGAEALALYTVLHDERWADRTDVLDLSAPERERLGGDVGELAFLMARAELLRPAGRDGTKLRALAAVHLGERDDSPRSAFLLAAQHTAEGRYRDALPLLKDATLRSPRSAGAWFLRARCHQALGETAEAMAAYATCLTLRPAFVPAYRARAGLCYLLGRDFGQARADLDEALRLDPHGPEARVDRGVVLSAMGRHRESLADLDAALRHPLCPARAYFVRADVRRRLGDAAGAVADRARGLREEPADAASYVARGMAMMADAPDAALHDFRRAEKLNPRLAEALIDQAYVLSELLGRPKEALSALDRLVRLHPDHAGGRAGRAVLLAREGYTDDAVTEARRCLALSRTPEMAYRAACILALASADKPERLREAKKLLASALLGGWGFEYVAKDADLEALRRDPSFGPLLEGIGRLQVWRQGR